MLLSKGLLASIIVAVFTLSFQNTFLVSAQSPTPGGGDQTIRTPESNSTCDPDFSDPSRPACLQAFNVVFGNILNVVMGLAGFAAFVFLIFGGFKFLTSQGDPKALQSARTTMTWAIGGLAMIVLSYIIIVIIASYTGVDQLKTFRINPPASTP